MATWIWIVVAVVIVAAVVVIAASLFARRRRAQGLQERFGPEYDRTVEEQGTRSAHSQLREREKRHEQFDIRPLEPAEQEWYRNEWRDVQARFVDDPALALGQADQLIMRVMRERGYPVEDFETRADDLSVDHPTVVENYREGHRLADEVEHGDDRTETLRRAMQHFRSLFDELVEPSADEPSTRDTADDGTPAAAPAARDTADDGTPAAAPAARDTRTRT